MWISKSKLRRIENSIGYSSNRVWELEHPPKFKRGDFVEVNYESRFTGYSYGFTGIIVNAPRQYNQVWRYDILKADNIIAPDELEEYIKLAENPNLSPLQAETPESDTNVPKSGESA